MAESNQQRNNNKLYLYLLLGFIVVLLVINGVYFYFDYKKDREQETLISNQSDEIKATYSKLESVSNELNDKIAEIKRLGGNVDSLMIVKGELEKDKAALRKNLNISSKRFEEIKDKLEGYETLLKEQEEKIAQLEATNKQLYDENTGLKTEKVRLADSISQLSVTRSQLEEKVALASVLKAENIQVKAINDKGKEKEGGEFKAKNIDKLLVAFNLGENKVAKIGGKEILICLTDPDNSPLYDIASGSGTFVYQGKEMFYTAKQDILFDNTRQRLEFVYEKGSEYKKGDYKVDIFADGYKIGSSSFIVK